MTTDIEALLRERSTQEERRAHNMRGDPEGVYADAALWEEAADTIAALKSLLAEAREVLRLYVNHAPTQPGGNAFTLENHRRAAEVLRKMEKG